MHRDVTAPRWAWLAAIGLAAAAVLGHDLLALPLWRDEVASVEAASRPVPRILAMLPVIDATHGTYYLLLHAVLGLGDPVVVARLFSLVCAVAAVVMVAEAARRTAGFVAGTAAAALVIGNPFFATYAREARPFALGAALVCAAVLVLLRPCEPRWASLAAFTALTVVAAYVHLFDLIPLVALLVASRLPWRAALVCGGVIAVAVAPLLWVASRETVQVSWMTPLPSDAAGTLAVDLVGGVPAAWVLYPLVAILLARHALRRRHPHTDDVAGKTVAAHDRASTSRPLVVAAAALAGPVVLLAVSYLVRPVYVERYVLASVPLLALAVGLLAGRSRVAAAAVVVVGLVGVPAAYAGPAAKTEDLAAAAKYVAAAERPGDCIAYTPSWARLGLAFYLRREHADPTDVAVSPDPPVGLFAAERPLPDVTADLARCPRIWVAGYTGPATAWSPVVGVADRALDAVRPGYAVSPPVAFGEFSVAMWTAERVQVASRQPTTTG